MSFQTRSSGTPPVSPDPGTKTEPDTGLEHLTSPASPLGSTTGGALRTAYGRNAVEGLKETASQIVEGLNDRSSPSVVQTVATLVRAHFDAARAVVEQGVKGPEGTGSGGR